MPSRRSKRKIRKQTLKIATDRAEKNYDAMIAQAELDQKLLRTAIKKLEQRIIADFSKLRTSDLGNLLGPKVNLVQAQKLHSSLIKVFDSEYGAASRKVVRGYNRIARLILRTYNDLDVAAEFTDIDKVLLKQLGKQNLVEFVNLGNQAKARISQALYNTIATQDSQLNLITEIRGALTGFESARGTPLSSYAELYAHDGIMNFYNSLNIQKGRQLGMRKLLYVGNIMKTTRDFCRRRAGKVYTVAQIKSWDHNWTGKRGPALEYRGGWRCRHHWQPVMDDWIEDGQ